MADELREVDADDMTVALYAVRGRASLRMDAEHAAMEAVLCVDPMEVGAAEKLGQQIEQQSREPVSYTHLDVYKRQEQAGRILAAYVSQEQGSALNAGRFSL